MRSIVFKGNEAVAKQAGKVSVFLEQCLTKILKTLAVGFLMQSSYTAFDFWETRRQ